jgi:hypothetical protein
MLWLPDNHSSEHQHVKMCCDRCRQPKCHGKPAYTRKLVKGSLEHGVQCRNPNCHFTVYGPKLWLAVQEWNRIQRKGY